jgi:hypothetical protein
MPKKWCELEAASDGLTSPLSSPQHSSSPDGSTSSAYSAPHLLSGSSVSLSNKHEYPDTAGLFVVIGQAAASESGLFTLVARVNISSSFKFRVIGDTAISTTYGVGSGND